MEIKIHKFIFHRESKQKKQIISSMIQYVMIVISAVNKNKAEEGNRQKVSFYIR